MKTQVWRLRTLAGFGVLAAWFIACSGEDIPQVDDQTREDLASKFPDDEGQEATAGAASSGGGAAGAGGSGGRAAGGSGGRAGSGSTSGGSGGSGSPATGGSGGACDAFTTILLPKCGTAGCHDASSTQGAFAVTEEGVTDFVNKKATYCDEPYIDSANPAQSLIYLKLAEDFPAGCGNLQMPANGDYLTEEEEACVLSWLGQF
jgi:hypothetical protein